jgi:hypothetical protein
MVESVECVKGGSGRRRYWPAWGEAMNRGADILVCHIGSIAGSAAWCERQPGVLWRKLYRSGHLGGDERSAEASVQLLSVLVDSEEGCVRARTGRERSVLCDDEHRDSRPRAGKFGRRRERRNRPRCTGESPRMIPTDTQIWLVA